MVPYTFSIPSSAGLTVMFRVADFKIDLSLVDTKDEFGRRLYDLEFDLLLFKLDRFGLNIL